MKIKLSLMICIILIAGLIIVETAGAIPAFARRYRISCSTCHAPVPKLKPYGDDFAGAGFILKEEEQERDYVSAGDDLLWLNRTFPVSVRFDAYAVVDQSDDVKSDLQTPWGLKLMSGGTLYKNIGYYFYFYMSERGEVAGIEDAYVHFDNVFGSSLDVMVGQFQTSDPLMKRELRLTFEDYMIYKQNFGESVTNLAYDRGVMLVYGIEKTGTDLVAFVVNGNGKVEADDNHKFDSDGCKNVGFRISQGIGDHFSIGGYYYLGREKGLGTYYQEWADAWPRQTNTFTYWGPDFNLNLGKIELTGQYLMREDDNLLLTPENPEVLKGYGVVLEAIFAPRLDRSRYYITALYNRIDHDLNAYDYETATLSATWLLARNLRLVAEYTRDLERKQNRMAVGFVSAF